MRYLIIAFCMFLAAVEIAFPVGAVATPPIDEIEAMLKRVEGNLRQASAVVSVAKAKGEKLVESKVEEKAELQEAVVAAEQKVEALEAVQEVFVAKMVAAGVDTTMTETAVEDDIFNGPMYQSFLEYQKNGGTEDFGYFRLYIYK
jgi:hypothetical protein